MEKEVSTHLIKCQTPLGKDCPSTPRICTILPAKRHHIPPQPIRTVLKLSVPKSGQLRCMLRTIQRNFDSLGPYSQHSCGQPALLWPGKDEALLIPSLGPLCCSWPQLCVTLQVTRQEARREERRRVPLSRRCRLCSGYAVSSSLACFSPPMKWYVLREMCLLWSAS